MLTTTDNPYNPNTDYDKWMMWDQFNEHYTSEYLARVANIPDNMDEEDAMQRIDDAIAEILENDTEGLYAIA